MENMLVAAAWCFGVSFLTYCLSCDIKREARILSSVIPTKELKELGELIGKKTTSLLVVVSGKVGSNEAFKCKRSGVLCVYLIEKAKLVYKTKEADEKTEESESDKSQRKKEADKCREIVLSRNTVPWFLEDDTCRVNVAGYHYSDLTRYEFDEPVNDIFKTMINLKGVKIVSHTCSEEFLEIGTPLCFFAEASRGIDGALTIRETNEITSYKCRRLCEGESVDKMVSNLKSNSKESLNIAVFLGTAGWVLFAMSVVRVIRKA